MAKHNELGKEGEEIAKKFLINKGYDILESNWRYERKEIDLIARMGEIIAIVEVKTRSTDFYGNPEESVTRTKQNFLIKAADSYAQALDFEAEIRYDIISIVMKSGKPLIKHFEDAFIPLLD
jgi:putative endonuclease